MDTIDKIKKYCTDPLKVIELCEHIRQELSKDTEILDWYDKYHKQLTILHDDDRKIKGGLFYKKEGEYNKFIKRIKADNIRDLILKAKGEG